MDNREFDSNEIIGMEFYTAFVWARSYKYTIRIVRKDGIDRVVVKDYQADRINVATQNDIIAEIIDFG